MTDIPGRLRGKLSDAEWGFLGAFAREPETSIAEHERAAGLEPGRGRALLQSARGRAAVAAWMTAAADRPAAIREQLLQLAVRLAYWDPADAFDADGKLRHPRDLPDSLRLAITAFTYHPSSGAVEYKFANRIAAADLLNKILNTLPSSSAGDGGAEGTTWVVRGRQALPQPADDAED